MNTTFALVAPTWFAWIVIAYCVLMLADIGLGLYIKHLERRLAREQHRVGWAELEIKVRSLEVMAEEREDLLRRVLPHLDDRVRDDNDAGHEDEDLISVYYDIRDELGIADDRDIRPDPPINFT